MKKVVGKVLACFMASLLVFATSAYAADDVNVAPKATVTASSEFNADNAGKNAVDGKPVKHGSGEWASKGELTPWLKLDWAAPVTIDRIVIYDRPNNADNANGGVITFSDGSTLDVTDIDPDGKPTEFKFAAKTITSLKFNINAVGFNPGLAEIEVFGKQAAAATPAPKAADTKVADTAANATAASNPKTGDSGTMPYLISAVAALIVGSGILIRKKKMNP